MGQGASVGREPELMLQIKGQGPFDIFRKSEVFYVAERNGGRTKGMSVSG